jgi:hypothetical protein
MTVVNRVAAIAAALILASCTTSPLADENATTTTGTIPTPDSAPVPVTDGGPDATADESSECDRLHLQFLTAMGSVNGSADTLGRLDDELLAVADGLPPAYGNDARVLANAYGEYGDVLAEFDGDLGAAMADPEAGDLLDIIGESNVRAAYESVTGYFDDTCPVIDEP